MAIPLRFSVKYFLSRAEVNQGNGTDNPSPGCTCLVVRTSCEIDQSTCGRIVSKDALAEMDAVGESLRGSVLPMDAENKLVHELHAIPGVTEVGICAYELLVSFSPLALTDPVRAADRISYLVRDFCCPSELRPEKQMTSWQDSSVFVSSGDGSSSQYTLSELLKISEEVGRAGQRIYGRLTGLRALSQELDTAMSKGNAEATYVLELSAVCIQSIADCVKFTRSRVVLDAITRKFAPDKR